MFLGLQEHKVSFDFEMGCVRQRGGIEMSFMEKLEQMLKNKTELTENGAIGYKTSGKELVDLNFAVSSLRSKEEECIEKSFIKAFYEDQMLAWKWLFFLRDVRGGLGERRTFRVILRFMAYHQPETVKKLVDVIAEYGRLDDLLCLFGTPLEEEVLTYLGEQLKEDVLRMRDGRTISLCGKWMPSNNASSERTKKKAQRIQNYLGMTSKQYRKMLVELRAYLSVLEVKASANAWEQVDYEKVPSRANLLYRNAFLRHDEKRRLEYLGKVERKEAKIQAGVLMPHEIVNAYTERNGWRVELKEKDIALEEMWKNLDDTIKGAEDVLCIVDGSGSMMCPVGGAGSSITAHQVSNALGIYFSERMKGAYKNKFITFSQSPKYVDFSRCNSLRAKLVLAYAHNDWTNTNLEATFDLVLHTATENNLKQEELPKTLLVISDMEFDAAVNVSKTAPLLEGIKEKFKRAGYQMPKLVFWNCNSRTNVIPVRENEMGVGLVSGFSVNVCNMVLSNQLDPYQCLKEQLNQPRYQVIEERVAG